MGEHRRRRIDESITLQLRRKKRLNMKGCTTTTAFPRDGVEK